MLFNAPVPTALNPGIPEMPPAPGSAQHTPQAMSKIPGMSGLFTTPPAPALSQQVQSAKPAPSDSQPASIRAYDVSDLVGDDDSKDAVRLIELVNRMQAGGWGRSAVAVFHRKLITKTTAEGQREIAELLKLIRDNPRHGPASDAGKLDGIIGDTIKLDDLKVQKQGTVKLNRRQRSAKEVEPVEPKDSGDLNDQDNPKDSDTTPPPAPRIQRQE
jgi:hypothetical protein